jgi:hypothetical protein
VLTPATVGIFPRAVVSDATNFEFATYDSNGLVTNGNGVQVKFGRMATFLGMELIETPLNPNVSIAGAGLAKLGVVRADTTSTATIIFQVMNVGVGANFGNLIDNTLAMHGSASSSFHLSRNYPIISAGGKNLGFTNGRYLKFGKGNDDNQAGAGIDSDAGWTGKIEVEELPLSNLFVTILQRLGVETDTFGGCSGTLSRV